METVGSRIKALRKTTGLSQKEFGAKFGIAQSTFHNYESERSDPSIVFIEKMTTHFGVTLDWFLFGRGPKHREVSASDSPTEFQSLLREYCRLQQENTELRQIVAKLKAEKGSVCQNGE